MPHRKELRQVLLQDPGNFNAHEQLAICLESNGNLAEAESVYKKAIALRPNYWVGYNNLGFFYYAHSRYQEALAMFQRVTEQVPDNVRRPQ